jgi:DNA polymerase-3 subunit gamma/tau
MKQFNELVEKIKTWHIQKELGECFEKNITFVSFENNILQWKSIADGKCKKVLIQNWTLIQLYVQEIFGLETKIKNVK